MGTVKGHLFLSLFLPPPRASWVWLFRQVMLELGLLLARPDGEEAEWSGQKPSALPRDTDTDRRTLSPTQKQQGGRL